MRSPAKSALLLLACASALSGCSEGEVQAPAPAKTRTLAQAEWDLAGQEIRDRWCRVYLSEGEKGILALPRTAPMDSTRDVKDLVRVLRGKC